MNFFVVLPYYFVWHYGRAYFDIKNVWKNLLAFIYNFFSIPLLLRTLFSPWQRISDGYNLNTPLYETLIFNLLMRLIGAMVRLFVILIGLALLFLGVIFGIAFFFIWLCLPAILVVLFLWGLKEIII